MLMAVNPSGGVELTSLDTGPGISNLARCFEDGFSTAGTPGNGLGAIQRLSDEMDLFSGSSGTVLWSRITVRNFTNQKLPPANGSLRCSGLSVPVKGETECGDSWRMACAREGGVSLIVADGLGHGPLAASASQAACNVFDGNPFHSPDTLIQTMHGAISGTRGAAVAIAQINSAGTKLTYAGVGNIAGTLLAADGSSRGLFSHNGTVGHQLRKVQLFEYPWSPGNMLVLHSDGVQTRWAMDKYAGLTRCHPGVIAGVLYRDFLRGRDDACIVVVGPPYTGN